MSPLYSQMNVQYSKRHTHEILRGKKCNDRPQFRETAGFSDPANVKHSATNNSRNLSLPQYLRAAKMRNHITEIL